MQALKTKLEGVLLIRPDIFEDHRGDYVMVYNKKEYADLGITCEFVEHCISTSRKGVLRGLHADYECDKLISVLHGAIYYILADMQAEKPQWESFILSDRNHWQIFKPARYAAGFLALEDNTVFFYAQSNYYDPQRQKTYPYNDAKAGIWWPSSPGGYIISQRDVPGILDRKGFHVTTGG